MLSWQMICDCLGRGPDSKALGLDRIKVKTDTESGKLIVDEKDETTAPHIYCIGDAAYVG